MLRDINPERCCCKYPKDPRSKENLELQKEIDRITVIMQRGCENHDKHKDPYCFDCYEYLCK